MTASESHRSRGADSQGSATHAKLRRRAWILGLVAFGLYLAFIAWNVFRGLAAGG